MNFYEVKKIKISIHCLEDTVTFSCRAATHHCIHVECYPPLSDSLPACIRKTCIT